MQEESVQVSGQRSAVSIQYSANSKQQTANNSLIRRTP